MNLLASAQLLCYRPPANEMILSRLAAISALRLLFCCSSSSEQNRTRKVEAKPSRKKTKTKSKSKAKREDRDGTDVVV